MLEHLRRRLDEARAAARSGAVALDALRKAGFGELLTAGGLFAFALSWRTIPRGPTAIIRFHAFNTPWKEALVDGAERLTYKTLDESVNRLAHGLRALGVEQGSRVAVMMRNCAAYLQTQWAVTRLGATLVQVGYRSKAPEIAYILENSKPVAFVYHRDHEDAVAEAQRSAGLPAEAALVRVPDRLAELLAGGDPAAPPPLARKWADLPGGVMVYTSGTTGKPKGAARHLKKNLHEAVADLMRQVGYRHDERHLTVCPLYHSAAPAFTALTYLVGGTVVLRDHFDPEEILATIARERITSSFMVPTMLGRLAALPEDVRKRHDTSSLRWLLSGAAPLPTETARLVEGAFGGVLYNFYGATETGMVTLALPGEHTRRPGTIGRALGGNEIRLVGEDGRDAPVGAVGEVWVRNSMIVDGYHGDEAATRKSLQGGFFSVGDMARVDADGYYYLADRKHDMVISGGVNIYPLEIEQHLYGHPAVLEAAVVGVPDPDWGEALKAFVVRRPGAELDADGVRAWCKRSLADFKCPKAIEFLDALPRNPTGKVLKRELRAR